MKTLHPVAGAIALANILTFWLSTATSELWASPEAVIAVKTAIPWGFLLLVPALAVAGGSGLRLARRRQGDLIDAKRRRMPIIAANGLLVLIPAAFFLADAAQHRQFDAGFYAVQAVELLAGAINITLLGLNMRDGLRMKGRRHRPAA